MNFSGIAWKLELADTDELLEVAKPFHVRHAAIAAGAVARKLGEVGPVGRGALDAVQLRAAVGQPMRGGRGQARVGVHDGIAWDSGVCAVRY